MYLKSSMIALVIVLIMGSQATAATVGIGTSGPGSITWLQLDIFCARLVD